MRQDYREGGRLQAKVKAPYQRLQGPLDALHESHCYASDEIRRTGTFYEIDVLEDIARRLTDGRTIVDAGAHIGNHSVFLARRFEHSVVHAFEPIAANVRLLLRNTRGLRVVVHACALSDRPETVRMTIDAKNIGHSRVTSDGETRVRAMRLDDFDLHDVALIKIDVEDYERAVIAGAARTIERERPLIVVEDWRQTISIDGYRRTHAWRDRQTYLYEPL